MQQMGLQARLMSQALRKMSGNASKAGCTLIFLNQIRYKVIFMQHFYSRTIKLSIDQFIFLCFTSIVYSLWKAKESLEVVSH